MKKLYRLFLYILPLVLCFSYFPVISLGSNETMNFELSLPLLWLVVFDILGFFMVCAKYRAKFFSKIFGSFLWWLFPFFATFSIAWSLNPLRGLLTAGVMWLLLFAVLWFFELRENLNDSFWKIFWRWFFGAALFSCIWCVVQCILDVAGVPQETSLLCDGCVYAMFGFPHPNGFSIEPQFMGNLLIAPIFVSVYFYFKNKNIKYLVLAFIFGSTLFLTFSRGAIYAVVAGLIFLFSFVVSQAKKTEMKKAFFSSLKVLAVFVVSFIFALNLQGIFAAVSPTSDTYVDGVAKVLNHLSLGLVDVRSGGEKVSEGSGETGEGEPVNDSPVENPQEHVENSAFDGYVAESTDTRIRLARAALDVWKKDFRTVAFGVGFGGAGQALYDNGLSPAPKEIVQNEYAELLLETGVVGISLFGVIVILAIRIALKNRKYAGLVLALLIAYGITFLFFSGLPNALQIVLLPGLLILL